MRTNDPNARWPHRFGTACVSGRTGWQMKNIINWSYERASWQWDLLCILIMCFIFLTPKESFNSKDPGATRTQPQAVKVPIANGNAR